MLFTHSFVRIAVLAIMVYQIPCTMGATTMLPEKQTVIGTAFSCCAAMITGIVATRTSPSLKNIPKQFLVGAALSAAMMTIHELGHAVANWYLTGEPIKIYLGTTRTAKATPEEQKIDEQKNALLSLSLWGHEAHLFGFLCAGGFTLYTRGARYISCDHQTKTAKLQRTCFENKPSKKSHEILIQLAGPIAHAASGLMVDYLITKLTKEKNWVRTLLSLMPALYTLIPYYLPGGCSSDGRKVLMNILDKDISVPGWQITIE